MQVKIFIATHFFFCLSITTFFSSCTIGKQAQAEKGYHYIFDGKSLNGWEYDPLYWRVEKGVLIGEVTPATLLKNNSFIIKKDLIVGDFELKAEYRISAAGNSGINYRSIRIDSLPYAMRGYQADIDGRNRYTGQNYEEKGRTTLAYRGQQVVINATENNTAAIQPYISNNAWTKATVVALLGNKDSLSNYIKKEDWNEYHLIVKGNRLKHFINNVLMSDVTDNDTLHQQLRGQIGVQVHVGPPMKIEYRNFRIKNL